jgi:hypothetical protein
VDLISYCLQNTCSPNVFVVDREIYQRQYKPLSCNDVLLKLKPEYNSRYEIEDLARAIGQSTKVLHVIDLPDAGYKAITIPYTPTVSIPNKELFNITFNLPCPEYVLPLRQDAVSPSNLQGIADLRPAAHDIFMTILGQVANLDGVALVDYYEFPDYNALVVRLNNPNHPVLSDARFLSDQIEQQNSTGHIAQVEWSQITPNSVKRTVPSNDTAAGGGQGTTTTTSTTMLPRSGSNEVQVNADIAILDTGVSLSHPDLNVYRNVSFVDGVASGDDDQGHGSHVAGIAAARDNSVGIVGVAPGARIWAIKICDKLGECKVSDQIKGIEYATKHADEIDVLNISIENSNSPALNNAIKEAIKAGITVVVAAGNYGTDASSSSPANSPDVLAVSAIGDSDGKCGSRGPPLEGSKGEMADDSFAFFSNFGPSVKMSAPGVDIFSTFNGTSYALDSGTSMAAPHVTGAAALFKAQFPDASPAEVISNITSSGTLPGAACQGGPGGYFTGDADGLNEPLLIREFRPR